MIIRDGDGDGWGLGWAMFSKWLYKVNSNVFKKKFKVISFLINR